MLMAELCLTDLWTHKLETKVGHKDPIILGGKIIAQRIKGTPGITG